MIVTQGVKLQKTARAAGRVTKVAIVSLILTIASGHLFAQTDTEQDTVQDADANAAAVQDEAADAVADAVTDNVPDATADTVPQQPDAVTPKAVAPSAVAVPEKVAPSAVVVPDAAATAAAPKTAAPSAGGRETITVQDAVARAIENNLSLESSRVSLDTKKRKNDLKWNEFIPAVDVRGTLAVDNKKTTASGFAPVPTTTPGVYNVVPYSVEAPQWHVLGNLSASLTIVAALFEGLKNYKLDYEAGLLSYEKAKAQMERDLRKLYNNILLQEANIRLIRDKYEAAENQAESARLNYLGGLAPDLTWMQARVAKENIKPNLDEAENNLRLSKANFAFTIGLDYNAEFDLENSTDVLAYIPFDTADMISRAAKSKPDILELRQNILVAQSGRKAQSLQLTTPYLNLAWNTNPVFIADPFKDSWSDSEKWQDSGNFSITLGMNLNSFVPVFKEKQGLKDLDNTIKNLNINLAQLVSGTEIEVYNTVLTLEKTKVSVDALTETVALAERSYQQTMEAYRAGLQTLLEVRAAADQLEEARLGVLAQNNNYRNGLIDLEYSLGVPFGTLSKK